MRHLFAFLIKTEPASCKDSVAFVSKKGYKIYDRVILNRRFEAEDGTVAEFFVNRTFTEQELHLENKNGKLYKTPEEYCDVTDTVILKPGEIYCIVNL